MTDKIETYKKQEWKLQKLKLSTEISYMDYNILYLLEVLRFESYLQVQK